MISKKVAIPAASGKLKGAEFDEQVDPQVMKNYRNAAQDGYEYELIKGADHSMKNPGANEARIRVLTEWFSSLQQHPQVR